MTQFCDSVEIFVPAEERISIAKYFLDLVHTKNFVKESSTRRQEEECASCEASTGNVELMKKAEMMTTAAEHHLNPKKTLDNPETEG